MTTTITKLWGCLQPKNWKIDQLRLRPEILDTCTIGLLVSKECIKVQNGCPYVSRNEPTIGSQENEYKTQLPALLFMNLDHESQQLGVPLISPNSWEIRSHIREPNQVWNQILYLLAKSQDLGMSYQNGLGCMHISPNSLKARIFFCISAVNHTVGIKRLQLEQTFSPKCSGLLPSFSLALVG